MPDLPIDQEEQRGTTPKTRSRRRFFGYLATFLIISWTALFLFFSKTSSPMAAAPSSTQDDIDSNTHMIKLLSLPTKYLPETGKHRHSGRLIIVGDVHGMKDDLIHLLDKVHFDRKHDHLILAGDMISKGPDSKGVVDLAMELGASGLRGNHEDRIILAYRGMLAQGVLMDAADPEEVKGECDGVEVSNGNDKDRALVRALGEKRIKWLEKCPVILRVGKLGSMGEVVVVHAGLAPGVKLEKQDPVMVMNMRTISDDGTPSDEREGTGWMKVWNKYQKTLPKHERSTVIYGHDSKRGLQVKKYSMGIDTGCLKGGQLSAVVIEGGHDDHTHKIVHVNCKDGR